MASPNVSINDLASFVGTGTGNDVSAIVGVLDSVKADVAAAAGIQLTDEVLTFAALPNNAAVTANADLIRYLSSRPSKLVNTLLNHVSTLNIPANADGTPSGVFVNAGTGAGFPVTTLGSKGSVWSVDVGQRYFQCQGATLDASSAQGKTAQVCAYDETSDFLYLNVNRDTAQFEFLDKNLGSLTANDISTATSVDLTSLFALVGAHGEFYDLTSNGTGHLTLFAPQESAFDLIDTANADIKPFLVWNKPITQLILQNHILEESTSPVWGEDVVDVVGADITPIGGSVINISDKQGGGYNIAFKNDNKLTDTVAASITATDVYTKNTVVHVIDQVLLSNAQFNIVADAIGKTTLGAALDTTAFATLLDLVGKASQPVQDAVGATAYTLLAPTEEAFAALTAEQVAYLVDPANQEDLDKVLKAHVLTSRYFGSGVTPVASGDITDANGDTVTCTGVNCSGGLGNQQFELKEQRYSKTGVVYTIDSVIVPDGTNIPAAPNSASTIGISAAVTAFAALAASFLF